MAEKKINLTIPRQSIPYMILCLIGLLILILVGIVPASHTLRGLDNKITVLKQQTEERNVLRPLYISMQQQSQKKETEVLPLPPPARLAPSMINTLPRVFRMAAGTSGVSLVSVVPNLNAMTGGDAQFIFVDVNVRGNIAAFRKFLIQVGGIPYVHHIEEMEVKVRPDNRDYKVKLRIAVG